MPQPPEVQAVAAQLTALYGRASARLQQAEDRLLLDWPALTRAERRDRLHALQQLANDLTSTADEQALRWTVTELPRAYLLGAIAVTSAQGLAGVDFDALTVLAQDTYADLLEATHGVTQSTKDLVRVLTKDHVGDKLLGGDTAQQAAKDLAKRLEGYGIRAITYANGSRHRLGDYTEMLLRTKTAEAYSRGNLHGMKASGITWAEVFDGTDCGWTSHQDPDKPNGTVRALTDCQAQPLSHPRCQRSFGARADVTNATEAAGAEPSTTPEQRADQAAVDRSRELVVARRASAKALSGRVDRRAQAILTDETSRIVSPAHARKVANRQVKAARDARLAARDTRLAKRAAQRPTP